ncbi:MULTISPECIES: GntR family transcriptional regulator [Thermoanaerobacterium]|jgi:transcriptional regulator, GntR family|uniref:DNA-binding GntR family transcriptional regulator n=1 Tax=Thermoanaerobacterium butyriciformans TaxID=1702242 RepID=A0ABS4NF88_9THEO|nr:MULTISPECIES: GntR family transcriptional regulator [Thermoanaerobacterium]MBP2072330.1 DNA-binding GntR family transcriptional regulator [Thermoanaerobacterium butyriciformans]WHE07358.1 GntR family transcriptional regulator [Thermoanaerobacterium thermosaccharolyticum]WKV07782.1 GntR family transcriptional regulator [Thermoanaerobacterium sp. CMT5567-10]
MNNYLPLENYKPLRDIVFDYMKNAIITGEFKPGERLMEVQLAEKLGVSRTPVREAIRKLELDGLVVMVPRKGAYVSDLSTKDLLNAFEVRQSLEGLAASLAAERITDDELNKLKEILDKFYEGIAENNTEKLIKYDQEFHDCIFNASRNEKLVQIMNNLQEHVHRFRVKYINDYRKSKKLYQEHKKILESLEMRNAENAQKWAEKHIQNFQNDLVKDMKHFSNGE